MPGNEGSPGRVGQRVTAIPRLVCGHCPSCQADCDYFCIDSSMVLRIPDTMTLEDAALKLA